MLFGVRRGFQFGEDECLDGVCFERPAEEEALDVVDVFVSEVVELVDCFDAFGDGLEAEVSAELDERSDQRVGLRGARRGRR